VPALTASAPGKIILFGEHAVVYGQPAIALPIPQVQAKAIIVPDILGTPGSVRIVAPEINLDCQLDALEPDHPLAAAIMGVTATLGLTHIPACTLKLTSTIPIAAGLGSGAAVSVAIIRALSAFLGTPLDDVQVNKLAYNVEKIHHGTPSGIDNTVVTYGKPVYFMLQQPIEIFNIARPFTIIIADTGIASPTALAVRDLRKAWQKNSTHFEGLFNAVGSLSRTARQAMETGHPERLGPLMNENHELLIEMGVSSPELDRLVLAAQASGSLGAKLSGGGRGGNMIVLTEPDHAEFISHALHQAGAINTIIVEQGARDLS
jgi:mevalonate kinase